MIKTLKGYIKKHSTCHLQIGANRGLIYDSNRKEYFLVPLSMIDFIESIEEQKVENLLTLYATESKEILEEYLSFLFEKEIIFICDSEEELKHFIPMNLEWKFPAMITNAIVEVRDIQDIHSFNNSKQNLFIPYIQFSLHFKIKSIAVLEYAIEQMLTDSLKGIQILFNNENNFTENEITNLCYKMKRIEMVIAYGSQYERIIQSSTCNIYFRTQSNVTPKNCGIINQQYFNLQLPHYTESLAHNTCLNRKIAIDVDGNIKNCPSMKESFGNIKDTTLEEAINKPGFKKYWNITKDQITKCKDCEFRHICTDCRAYIDNPDDIFCPLEMWLRSVHL